MNHYKVHSIPQEDIKEGMHDDISSLTSTHRSLIEASRELVADGRPGCLVLMHHAYADICSLLVIDELGELSVRPVDVRRPK